MKVYSLHNITDGKWTIKLLIRENDDFKHSYESRPDLRAIVDAHYNSPPEQLAKTLLRSVMGCDSVEVNLFCGPGVYVERV
jgi:hypothetical protein